MKRFLPTIPALLIVMALALFLFIWIRQFYNNGVLSSDPAFCSTTVSQTPATAPVVTPGAKVTYTVRLYNCGIAGWGDFKVVHIYGEPMTPQNLVLPTTRPKQEAEFTIPITAPQRPGRYIAVFELQDARSLRFGATFAITVNVGSNEEALVFPVPQQISGQVPGYCSEVASYTPASPITVDPGTQFTQTLRLHNCSKEYTWFNQYDLVQVYGQLSTVTRQELPNNPQTYPGDFVEVSIPITAPSQPGTYLALYELEAPMGLRVGSAFAIVVTVK